MGKPGHLALVPVGAVLAIILTVCCRLTILIFLACKVLLVELHARASGSGNAAWHFAFGKAHMHVDRRETKHRNVCTRVGTSHPGCS